MVVPTLQRNILQLARPELSHEIMTETTVWRRFDEREAGRLLDSACGNQNIIGPQNDSTVAGGPGKSDALIHESSPYTEAATLGVDQKASKLRGIGVLIRAHDKYTAGTYAVDFGDPKLFRC